jgi:hypothetical protein
VGLLDDITAEQDKTQPNRCPVAKIIPQLNDDDLADFDAAMHDDSIRHVAIARALERRGYRVTGKSIASHRSDSCACARG